MERGLQPRSGPRRLRLGRPTGLTTLALFVIVVVSGLTSYLTWTASYDYVDDAGPPIDALVHGRIEEFLTAHAMMGPLSLIVRAPFAAIAQITGGADVQHLYEGAYKWGVFPCMLAAGLLGLYLARIMAEQGRPRRSQFLVAALCMLSTPVLKALQYGHPEEILGAVLCVGAVVAGLRGHSVIAIVLAALAVTNKQWGIVVLLPVALTLPWRDVKIGAAWIAAAAAISIVPLAIVDLGSLQGLLAGISDLRDTAVMPASVWWPFLPGSANFHAGQHVMPDWLGFSARPLLIAVCVAVPLLLARRVREDPVNRALPLLALVLLLRCMLDPLNNVYYHVPFLLALLAADAFTASLAPALIATAALYVMSRFGGDDPQTLAAMYLTWAPATAVYLVGRTYGLDWAAYFRSRGARGQAAAQPAHLSSSGTSTPQAR